MSLATGNRNGDQYDDLLIGAGMLTRPDDLSHPGGAYFLYGRARSEWDPFIDLSDDYNMIFYGVEANSPAGYQVDRAGFVTGMGDLDNNGLAELFIAAPFADGPGNSIPDCGEIYVIYDDEHLPTGANTPPIARAALLPNYPNPFASSTTFHVQAPAGENISLTIYDARGREVARPILRALSRGDIQIVWNGRTTLGTSLPSGVYFAKLVAGREVHSRKVVLVH
jgi:hypothetical protein